MKRPVTHVPTITTGAAACSCRAWPGLTRQESETIGAFTNRANDAHRSHVRAVQESPVDLFSAPPDTQPAFGLFAREEAAQ